MEQTKVIKPETLDDLIKTLRKIYERGRDKVNVKEVQSIMEAYESKPQEWEKFAYFTEGRYTRNLVDEGNGKFNLMILCWGKGYCSSIHDHTDASCFMKILQGQMKETLFEWPDPKLPAGMVQKSQRVLLENQCAYIEDSIGLHRMENVSYTENAVSLHLYSPMFKTCQTFDQHTGYRKEADMTFWSRYGERTPSGFQRCCCRRL
ncbi:cysteine dioxygenase type 1-like [Siphateles boraxobius]|uniref:cysteine dioxygenase type 1-like n=1 Tax=Siphateles boraxobius TaxID=180520 RepID=UPI0040645238